MRTENYSFRYNNLKITGDNVRRAILKYWYNKSLKRRGHKREWEEKLENQI